MVKKCIVLLTWLCCILPFYVQAQKEVRLISSRDYEARKEWGVNRFYKPVFLHEGSTLSADSSDYNPEERFFDAFGNVVITQPNGTVVYADKLHYIKDDRIAILTNNVRMVDPKGAVLTTNHLTYNLNSKIGTYTDGGRIVNEKDTLNSKTGYYFENSSDAYFRHDVVVRTSQSNIFTDTLRYNSLSKMAYFYGPTNIKGKNGGNLYTENGDYHTESDRARFGKNNLYTEGSKFLRGDSLYYDGKLGYGRAIKNVVFIDTAQQGILYGQRGIYLKKDESITMTERAYMIMVVNNDSTARDSGRDSLATDSLAELQLAAQDSISRDTAAETPATKKTDSVYMAADTLYSQVIFLRDYKPIELNLRRDGGDLDAEEEEDFTEGSLDSLSSEDFDATAADSTLLNGPDSLDLAQSSAFTDSLARVSTPGGAPPGVDLSADSLMRMAGKDSLNKTSPLTELNEDSLQRAVAQSTKLREDSVMKSERQLISKELAADSLLIDSMGSPPKVGEADSSLLLAKNSALNAAPRDSSTLDTARTRIVKAFHHMRIFKSDLQARADSAYYGYPDSIIRCYGNPMIWAQGSQLSGDTIYMQLKNQKLDNMLLKANAFIVSTQLDSVKFNQVKGRKITGFFRNNKLDLMYVDGNAESIYYTQESNKINGMTKSIGARIKIIFSDNEVAEILNIRKTETSYTPVAAFDADKEILPGFIWKPKDRPKSKEEIINPIAAIPEPVTDTTAVTASDSLQRDTTQSSALPKQPLKEKQEDSDSAEDQDKKKAPEGKENGITAEEQKQLPDSLVKKGTPPISN
ncbi:OstA-like protein [Olivibacter sp. XZL3]|uniref:OstA-like protein n=1 Tax=Olivibacter sp. XZL3 TaxID=1735116 RepID=UPI001066975B|nr:OstA-like protein [Olivibacter sp. XZL3]